MSEDEQLNLMIEVLREGRRGYKGSVKDLAWEGDPNSETIKGVVIDNKGVSYYFELVGQPDGSFLRTWEKI